MQTSRDSLTAVFFSRETSDPVLFIQDNLPLRLATKFCAAVYYNDHKQTPNALCIGSLPHLWQLQMPNALWPQQKSVAAANNYYTSDVFKAHAGRQVALSDPTMESITAALNSINSPRKVAKFIAEQKKFSNIVFEGAVSEQDVKDRYDGHLLMYRESQDAFLIQAHVPMRHEYRVLVIGGVPVTGAGCIEMNTHLDNGGSLFDAAMENIRGDGETINKPELAEKYKAFADMVATKLKDENPDCLHYTLDLATDDDGNISIIELNPAYNFGMYAMDYEAGFKAIIEFLGYKIPPERNTRGPFSGLKAVRTLTPEDL